MSNARKIKSIKAFITAIEDIQQRVLDANVMVDDLIYSSDYDDDLHTIRTLINDMLSSAECELEELEDDEE